MQRVRDEAARLRQRDENRQQQRQRQTQRAGLFPGGGGGGGGARGGGAGGGDYHAVGGLAQSTGFFPSLFGLQFQSFTDPPPASPPGHNLSRNAPTINFPK